MSELIAGLGRDGVLELYRSLRVTRAAEERLEALHEAGHVTGSLYRSLGQEAGAVGAAYALRRRTDGTGDCIAQTVRAAGAVFLFGGELTDFFRQYTARGTAPSGGKDAHVHWVDLEKGFIGPVSPLGTMVEVMAGIALTFRLRGQERVGVVFCGDGASSTGAWHEGLCFAAAQRVPMILIVENNQYAFSTPTEKNTRLESFVEKGSAYGVEAEAVDGTDVIAVYETVSRAADRARRGGGTQLVELNYLRRRGDDQHDDQAYVPAALIAEWAQRDPIDLFHSRILEQGWASEEELASIATESFETCRIAAERAISEDEPDASQAAAGVYTDEPTPHPWTRAQLPDPRMA